MRKLLKDNALATCSTLESGRLVKTINGVRKEYRYDGENLIFEMDASDSVIASYTFGPGIDNPLMMNRDDSNYYYVKDGLGSVTAITDSVGNVVQEYEYSVFGKIMDINTFGGDTITNSFTYTAREWEPEVGLYYYRARFYDAGIGRFLSEDPIGLKGGNNFYRYVFNNSVNNRDPFGLKDIALPINVEGQLKFPKDPKIQPLPDGKYDYKPYKKPFLPTLIKYTLFSPCMLFGINCPPAPPAQTSCPTIRG